VNIQDSTQPEEQDTKRSQHTEFAAFKLPRCLVCIHKRVADCVTVCQYVYFSFSVLGFGLRDAADMH